MEKVYIEVVALFAVAVIVLLILLLRIGILG